MDTMNYRSFVNIFVIILIAGKIIKTTLTPIYRKCAGYHGANDLGLICIAIFIALPLHHSLPHIAIFPLQINANQCKSMQIQFNAQINEIISLIWALFFFIVYGNAGERGTRLNMI